MPRVGEFLKSASLSVMVEGVLAAIPSGTDVDKNGFGVILSEIFSTSTLAIVWPYLSTSGTGGLWTPASNSDREAEFRRYETLNAELGDG